MGYDIANIPVDLILNILNVILFVIIVRTLVYKPVKKFINERRAKIDADLDDAKAAKAEAEAMKAEYDGKMKAADEEAGSVVSAARAEAKKQAKDILDESQSEKSRIVEKAREDAEKEKKKILDSVSDEVVDASALMAEKLLERSVSDEDTKRIAKEFFASRATESKK